MVTTRETHQGIPWDGRAAYEKWVEDGLGHELHRGYAVGPLKTFPVAPWQERNISAAGPALLQSPLQRRPGTSATRQNHRRGGLHDEKLTESPFENGQTKKVGPSNGHGDCVVPLVVG